MSTKVSGPDWRRRTLPELSTPSISAAAAAIFSFSPAGARSRRTSIVRLADVDRDRDDDDEEGPQTGFDVDFAEEDPAHGLVDDPGAGEEEQQGLDEGRDVLDLAVSVGVRFVRRPVRDTDGDEGDQRGDEVESRMGGLGQDAERAAEEADDELHPRQAQGGQHGAPRGPLLLVAGQIDGRGFFVGQGFRRSLKKVY